MRPPRPTDALGRVEAPEEAQAAAEEEEEEEEE